MIHATLLLSVVLASAAAPAWELSHQRIAGQRDALAQELGMALRRLRLRVMAEFPQLLPRLRDAPPAPRPTGYGLLPELLEELPQRDSSPWENCYDMTALEDWVERERGQLRALVHELDGGTLALGVAVDRYLLARENWSRIDAHVAYHEMWQRSAAENQDFFRGRNERLADFRLFAVPARSEAERLAAAAARERVEDDLLGFHPLPGPRLRRQQDGSRVLDVPLATDIEDASFRDRFTESIERNWNGSAAMRAAGLRIKIEWSLLSSRDLYPAGSPRRGDAIDVATHRRSFGAAPLVLSTGAAATHAFLGAVFLGTAPTTPRTLAHEFGHLLGFSDGYLRGHEGALDDPRGLLFIEVGPFPESLMASPGTGRVTEGMVRRLIEGYGGTDAGAPHP